MSLYLYTAVGVVLFVFMVGQVAHRKKITYNEEQKIAVRTANETIKMSPQAACTLLLDIKSRCVRLEKVCEKNPTVIEEAIIRLQRFIKESKVNLCDNKQLLDMPLDLANRAMQDRLLPERAWYADSILIDMEDERDDIRLYDKLLNHIDATVSLLHNRVCVEGILDIVELERLLLQMEKDLDQNGRFVDSVGRELSSHFEVLIPQERRFISRLTGPMEGFNSQPTMVHAKIDLAKHKDGRHLIERGDERTDAHRTLSHINRRV